MKKLFQPSSLLLYFLTIFIFFFAGMLVAGLTGAAKGQGLAGGAIVIGYGFITACCAFILAIVAAYTFENNIIKKINRVFLGVLAMVAVFIAYRQLTRVEKATETIKPPTETTRPADVKPQKTVPADSQ